MPETLIVLQTNQQANNGKSVLESQLRKLGFNSTSLSKPLMGS